MEGYWEGTARLTSCHKLQDRSLLKVIYLKRKKKILKFSLSLFLIVLLTQELSSNYSVALGGLSSVLQLQICSSVSCIVV